MILFLYIFLYCIDVDLELVVGLIVVFVLFLFEEPNQEKIQLNKLPIILLIVLKRPIVGLVEFVAKN